MRQQILTAMMIVTTATATTVVEDEKEKIQAAMKFAHKAPKGEKKLSDKIIDGSASNEDINKALRSYRGMIEAKPPKGDEEAFKARVIKLVAALEDVIAKKPKAIAAYKEAVNCKACHSEHRED